MVLLVTLAQVLEPGHAGSLGTGPEYNRWLVATEPVVTEPDAPETAPAVDIRRVRPALFQPAPLKALARRLFSVTALVVIDLASVALALYLGLVLKEVYQGRPALWGILWQAERDWIPFIGLITVLVFWRNGLYATREARSGIGRVVSSLVLVCVVSFVFAIGTGHHFSTFLIFPTVLLLAILLDGLLRASYDIVTKDMLRVAGVRRRAALVGESERIVDLHRMLGASRGGIDYEFVAEVAPSSEAVAALLANQPLDEIVIAYEEVDERELAEIVDEAHRRGVKVRVAPRPSALIVDHAVYVPGQGVPLFELRPAAFTGADWAIKRGFDVVVGAAVVVIGLPLGLLIAAAIKLGLAGAGVLPRSPHRPAGAGVPDVQVPNDGRRRRVEAGVARGRTRPTGRCSRSGRPARDPRRRDAAQALARRGAAGAERAARRDEPRRAAAAAVARLRPARGVAPPALPRPARDDRPVAGLGPLSLTFDELVRLDFFYIENWSIWLDITILLKTIPAVLARRGAY